MHSLADLVRIKDRVIFDLGRKLGRYLISNWDKLVEVRGFVQLYGVDDMHRIVPGTRREGYNVCTSTGREWYARMSGYASYGATADLDTVFRNDRIRYIGFGNGTQEEKAEVERVASPLAWDGDGDLFLAEVNAPPAFPLASSTSSGSAVQFSRTFSKTEISVSGTQQVSEIGLFTDGDPESDYAPRTRDTSIAAASDQPPMFYKAFEAFPKTQKFALAALWDVRF